MKKLLLVALLMCGVTATSFAQLVQSTTSVTERTYEKKKNSWETRYQGELNLGYATGGKLNNDAGEAIKTNFSRPFIETIHGVRVGDYLYVGLGVSVQYAYGDWVTGDDAVDFGDAESSWDTVLMPIFLNLKGYYPMSDNFAPYISLSMGATVILSSDLEVPNAYYSVGWGITDGNLKGGFYYDLGLGFNYKKLNFGFGLMHQGLKNTLDYYDIESKWNVNSFYVKVGLKF